jgi:hypothetical protein
VGGEKEREMGDYDDDDGAEKLSHALTSRSGVSPAQSAGQAALSMLGEEWPTIQESLLRFLSRRVDRATAEDICQDIALDAVGRTGGFASPLDLRKWSYTAAWRKAWRYRKAGRRVLLTAAVPDRPAHVDLDELVAHRVAIEELRDALPRLRDEDRLAVLSIDSPNVTVGLRRARDREALRRKRSRERLRGLVKNFPALVWLRMKDALRREPVAEVGQVVAGVALTLAAVVAPALGGSGVGPIEMQNRTAAGLSGVRPVRPADVVDLHAESPLLRSERASSVTTAGGPAGREPVYQANVSVVAPTGSPVSAWVMEPPDRQPLVCVATVPDRPLCADPPVPTITLPI